MQTELFSKFKFFAQTSLYILKTSETLCLMMHNWLHNKALYVASLFKYWLVHYSLKLSDKYIINLFFFSLWKGLKTLVRMSWEAPLTKAVKLKEGKFSSGSSLSVCMWGIWEKGIPWLPCQILWPHFDGVSYSPFFVFRSQEIVLQ